MKLCQKAIFIRVHDHRSPLVLLPKAKTAINNFFATKIYGLRLNFRQLHRVIFTYVMTTSLIVVAANFHHVIYGYLAIRL